MSCTCLWRYVHCESCRMRPISSEMAAPTGLFRVCSTFDTPLISVVDGPILKYFEVVRAITSRFDLAYNNASQVGNYPPSKYGITF